MGRLNLKTHTNIKNVKYRVQEQPKRFMNLAYEQPRLFYLWCVKKEYNMGKEQIMEDAVRDLTELALQEHREKNGEAEQKMLKRDADPVQVI